MPPRRYRVLESALLGHARVIHALVLRDIKTRFGGTYYGFLFGLSIPLAHVGVVLAIYILLGRRAPIGTDVTVYLTTAILPFVVWSYTHQRIIQAFHQNRPLTAFPVVKDIDIFMARAIVELLESAVVSLVIYLSLVVMGSDLFIYDPPGLLLALMTAYLLGVGTGYLLGVLAAQFSVFGLVGYLFIPIYWVTSGVFFIPDALPAALRAILWFFPLSHIVDFGRTSFYGEYASDYANMHYVFAIIITNILLALVFERILRSAISSH